MAKTAFWYAVMALTVVGSAVVAMPTTEIVEPEPVKSAPEPVKSVSEPVKSDAELIPSEQTPPRVTESDAASAAESEPSSTLQTAAEPEQPTKETVAIDTPVNDDAETFVGPAKPGKPSVPAPHGVRIGSNIPFIMEFFQPLSAFPGFPGNPAGFPGNPAGFPGRPAGFPVRQDAGGVNPFDSFMGPMAGPNLNQMVEAYTNEFRTPGVIIIKPKRNAQSNNTSIPPIPLLLNVMLKAFQHDPSDMLATFEKSMLEMEKMDKLNKEIVPNMPVNKTTSKTEIIDGHVVQVNETTYSNGDGDHQSFFHFKKIHVMPESTINNSANEKVISITKDDSEAQKLETNEIKGIPSEKTETDNNKPNYSKKRTVGPVSLDDHYRTAAAGYWPYGGRYYSVRPVSMYAPPPAVAVNGYQHGRPPFANQAGPQWQPAVGQYQYHGRPQPQPAFVDHYGRPPPPHPAVVQHHYYGGPPPAVGQHHGNPQPIVDQHHGNPHHGNPQQVVDQHHGNPQSVVDQQHGTPLPISLHGDTLVNQLAAAQQQASGHHVLPPDVEIVDVHGKPQGNGRFYYNNNHYGNSDVPRSRTGKN